VNRRGRGLVNRSGVNSDQQNQYGSTRTKVRFYKTLVLVVAYCCTTQRPGHWRTVCARISRLPASPNGRRSTWRRTDGCRVALSIGCWSASTSWLCCRHRRIKSSKSKLNEAINSATNQESTKLIYIFKAVNYRHIFRQTSLVVTRCSDRFRKLTKHWKKLGFNHSGVHSITITVISQPKTTASSIDFEEICLHFLIQPLYTVFCVIY